MWRWRKRLASQPRYSEIPSTVTTPAATLLLLTYCKSERKGPGGKSGDKSKKKGKNGDKDGAIFSATQRSDAVDVKDDYDNVRRIYHILRRVPGIFSIIKYFAFV